MPRRKPVDEFCDAFDSAVGCKSEYGCELACPQKAFLECLKTCVDDGVAMREALKRYLRRGLSHESAVKIIEGKFGMSMGEIQKKLTEEK